MTDKVREGVERMFAMAQNASEDEWHQDIEVEGAKLREFLAGRVKDGAVAVSVALAAICEAGILMGTLCTPAQAPQAVKATTKMFADALMQGVQASRHISQGG